MRDDFLEEFSDNFWDTDDTAERRRLIESYLGAAQGDDERKIIGRYLEIVTKQEAASA